MDGWDEQAARGLLRVHNRPVQAAGADRLVRSATIGGPDKEGDRRVYLDSATLARLLEVARSSTLGRVEVQRAGVRVDLYERSDGHRYEVWTLVGADPRPEPLPATLRGLPGLD